uniref:Nucleoside diphosphate kinase n=1 Tax=Paulinella chromatophora TaxID=39717 RepID=B1X4D7_PAUCH|nr:Nucleoside-diphosphate kinase [Paulinella chromatophora]ACB42806.1 Nucleoside-diphosphate kinase [Paulinella chromatophora]
MTNVELLGTLDNILTISQDIISNNLLSGYVITERTFIAIKPDGFNRGLVGDIITRFENKGFKLVALKQLIPTVQLAEKHYGIHKERPFFSNLVKFMTSGSIIAMVWEGEGVIASARKLIGATNPLEAEAGSIRGDLATNIGRNVIHGSDSMETAIFEIDLWFGLSEIIDWIPSNEKWHIEK